MKLSDILAPVIILHTGSISSAVVLALAVLLLASSEGVGAQLTGADCVRVMRKSAKMAAHEEVTVTVAAAEAFAIVVCSDELFLGSASLHFILLS